MFSQKLCVLISAWRGEWGSVALDFPHSARRGKSTTSTYTEGQPYDIKKNSARGSISPLLSFGPVSSARHTSKDAQYPQPCMNRTPRGEDGENSRGRRV